MSTPPPAPPDGLFPLLTADGMRAADRATMGDWGVPGRVLMETAGRAAVDAIAARYAVEGARVTVLAGRGNNGGDGLVIARVLAARGAHVRCLTLATEAEASADTAANLRLLTRLADASDRVEVVPFDDARQAADAPADLVVDALLGIGASGPLREPVRGLCAWAGRQSAPVVAVDLPSGLDATTGGAADETPRADLTVTFAGVKAGLVLGDGPQVAGEVVVAEMGIPRAEVDRAAAAHTATDAWVAAHLPRRAADAYKYSAGTAVCVVGSGHFTGAAVLSTAAAYRAGAGAVVACTPQSAQATVDAQNVEVMVDAQPETDGGTLAWAALDGVRERAESADAVLVGCGLGRDDETLRLVRALVQEVSAPLVLDADGFSAFAGGADALGERSAPLVLTPHLGELRRLLGDDGFDPEDRIETVRRLAVRWGAVLVLKGMPSVVGTPDGRVVVGPPGRPALATAGTGDVLAGTVAGLLAQGLDPADAAVCALHLGAAAADAWARDHGAGGLVASDLLDRMPRAAAELFPRP
ncbi:NAD(P)H-hydrate dehydratase [Rubrivirga sp. S365]|uniref:NAD(P)H-hydrate dehydratase n=1 Tax=Rubrivirga sp. S365 TaxID=3076080 RepID=UPI0028C8D930|nr:NAD(P)H-hydrate dehydratase [Rubrivirga sp. S365]MDT7857877.1 NAD(P)H-hydrate dehydratase [Rubrivirga sp. S365]